MFCTFFHIFLSFWIQLFMQQWKYIIPSFFFFLTPPLWDETLQYMMDPFLLLPQSEQKKTCMNTMFVEFFCVFQIFIRFLQSFFCILFWTLIRQRPFNVENSAAFLENVTKIQCLKWKQKKNQAQASSWLFLLKK